MNNKWNRNNALWMLLYAVLYAIATAAVCVTGSIHPIFFVCYQITAGLLLPPIIIEIARKTPADLGRPRDISACLIYWFLFLFLYFSVFSYLRLCSSVFCESIYSLTFSMTVVPVVAMK